MLPDGGRGAGGDGGGEPAVAAVAAMVGVSALVTAAFEQGDSVTLVAGMACLDLPCWCPPHLWGADGPGWLALGCVITLACP